MILPEMKWYCLALDADYPMDNGNRSTGLIAAVPLEYITDFLSLEDEGQLMYYHIIRPRRQLCNTKRQHGVMVFL